jgi:pyruvyltransferase
MIILNGKRKERELGKTNFGDTLTYWMLKHMTDKPIYYNVEYDEEKKRDKEKMDDGRLFFGIGSLLALGAENGSIWSSGSLFYSNKKLVNCEVYALRGKLSADMFGYKSVPLGDGGLIVDRFYKPQITEKKYKLCVIPHYIDYDNIIQHYPQFQTDDVVVIDVCNTTIEDIIDIICSSEYVISSSLHGIITADCYNIPNRIFQERVSRVVIHDYQKSFKFIDYYSAFDLPFYKSELLNLMDYMTVEECIKDCGTVQQKIGYEKFSKIKDDLYNSFLKCFSDYF